MRDLADYQKEYLNQPYEKHQVAFRKRKIKEILSAIKHDSILEIGCGLEAIFHVLDDFNQLVILEPAELFYKKTVDDISTNKLESKVNVFNLLLEEAQLQLVGKNFDVILVSSLLHEIKEQEKFLNQINLICSKETIIHINVPNAKSFHRLLAKEMGLIKNEHEKSESNIKFQQNTVFDLEQLVSLAEKNGFCVIDSGSYSFKPFTHAQMQEMLDKKIISEKTLDGFYAMEKYMSGMGSEIFVNLMKK